MRLCYQNGKFRQFGNIKLVRQSQTAPKLVNLFKLYDTKSSIFRNLVAFFHIFRVCKRSTHKRMITATVAPIRHMNISVCVSQM